MDVWIRGLSRAAITSTVPCEEIDLTFLDSNDATPTPQPATVTTTPPEPQYGVVDSASSATTRAATPCKVCGDKASGYHYGVTSCEGCKGFFRRSIQKQIEYRCLRDGKCLVIRLNRNRCQFCRFKKCLAVGMSRDSVRYGRVPKRARESTPVETPSVSSTASTSSSQVTSTAAVMAAPPSDFVRIGIAKDVGKSVIAAHHSSNTYTDEVKQTLQHHDILVEFSDLENAGPVAAMATSSAEGYVDKRTMLFSSIAQRVTPAVPQVVEFAKRLPGFFALPQDDQLILIKMGFFEVWLTRVSRLSAEDCLVFDDGSVANKYQLEAAYGDVAFAGSLLAYVKTVAQLQLTEDEVGLFCAALLLTTGRPGLMDLARVEKLQNAVTEALYHHINGGLVPTSRMDAVNHAIDQARAVGYRYSELMIWCRANVTRLSLPPLFAEVFDIPKTEENFIDLASNSARFQPQPSTSAQRDNNAYYFNF